MLPSDKKNGGPMVIAVLNLAAGVRGLYGSQTINTGTAQFVQKRGASLKDNPQDQTLAAASATDFPFGHGEQPHRNRTKILIALIGTNRSRWRAGRSSKRTRRTSVFGHDVRSKSPGQRNVGG